MVSRNVPCSHRYYNIVHAIRKCLSLNWNVNLKHTLREGNRCADYLAKLGARIDVSFQAWSTPPTGMNHLLLADALNTQFLRD